MTANNYIPIFVLCLNILTVGIGVYNLLTSCNCWKDAQLRGLIVMNIFISIAMECVNLPSAIRQYEVYFVDNLQIKPGINVLLFADRYAMFFLVVLSNFQLQQWVTKHLNKWLPNVRSNVFA